MITGTTASGFAYSIPDENVNNMEFLDALGDEQRKALYDRLRGEDGRVPVESVMADLKDILANDSSKNS